MTLDLEKTDDQGSFLCLFHVPQGAIFIVCVRVLWYIGAKEGGEEIEDSVYQSALSRPCDSYLRPGMVHSVPMVVIPFVSDQPVKARQVEKLGLGKVLDHKGVTADILKETAAAVMEDTQIRENLRKIQEEITCVPGNAGAVGIIEAYSQR